MQIKINGASGILTFESGTVQPTRAHIRRIIHPFSKLALQIAGEEIEYELGYPSDLIPFGPQSAVFDSFLQKINIGDIGKIDINDKQFKVRLADINHSMPAKEYSNEDKIAQATTLRELGNEFYKKKKFVEAKQAYRNSLYWSGIIGFKTEEDQTKKTEMAGKIISNLSAIHFFEKNWATTVTCCNKVIEMSKTTDNIVKNINTVYLRLAEAQERQNNFDLSFQATDLIKSPTAPEEKRIKTIQDRIASKTRKNDEVMSKRLKNLFA